MQPTRGLDVGSIEYIHKRLIEQRDSGKAVLLVSLELDEILDLSDRITVIHNGTLIDTVEASATDEKKADKPAKKRKSKAKAEAPAEAVAAPAVLPPPADIPTPIVTPSVPEKDVAVREIPVPAPADLKLIPLDGQGRRTEVEGELRAAPLINEAPTRYRVVRWQDNRWQILCHVYGEASKFRSLQDKRVHLQGRQYWIQGAAAPVLVPDQIREVQGE